MVTRKLYDLIISFNNKINEFAEITLGGESLSSSA
jgi:hypothetical protein